MCIVFFSFLKQMDFYLLDEHDLLAKSLQTHASNDTHAHTQLHKYTHSQTTTTITHTCTPPHIQNHTHRLLRFHTDTHPHTQIPPLQKHSQANTYIHIPTSTQPTHPPHTPKHTHAHIHKDANIYKKDGHCLQQQSINTEVIVFILFFLNPFPYWVMKYLWNILVNFHTKQWWFFC
jgi:hypothetical protein